MILFIRWTPLHFKKKLKKARIGFVHIIAIIMSILCIFFHIPKYQYCLYIKLLILQKISLQTKKAEYTKITQKLVSIECLLCVRHNCKFSTRAYHLIFTASVNTVMSDLRELRERRISNLVKATWLVKHRAETWI